MIRHLIIFNTPEGVSSEACQAMAELARQELSQIPGVLSVSFGVAIAEHACYRYNFTIDLCDEGALRTYQEHPIHVAFASNHFRPLAPDRITTDYEVSY